MQGFGVGVGVGSQESGVRGFLLESESKLVHPPESESESESKIVIPPESESESESEIFLYFFDSFGNIMSIINMLHFNF